MDGNRSDPHLARRSEDADGDLAPVGDEEAADAGDRYFLPRFPFSQSAQRPYVFIWSAIPLFSSTRTSRSPSSRATGAIGSMVCSSFAGGF